MDIILAKSAGFCFGVSNAIKILDCAIEKNSGKIYTLGEIIHNNINTIIQSTQIIT